MIFQGLTDNDLSLDGAVRLFSDDGDSSQPTIQVPVPGADAQADEPDPNDALAAEFTAFRKPVKDIAIIGSRNIPLPHQNLIEALSFMLIKDGNRIVTSGGSSGTNAACIRGAKRSDAKQLKVILPQTLEQQPSDVQNELIGIGDIVEHPEWEKLSLGDASRLCNREVIDHCQQLVIILFHDSNTLKQAIEYAEDNHKIVTTFYLD